MLGGSLLFTRENPEIIRILGIGLIDGYPAWDFNYLISTACLSSKTGNRCEFPNLLLNKYWNLTWALHIYRYMIEELKDFPIYFQE